MRAILRSPFHRVLSSRFLVLSFVGRSTGRAYALPLVYIEEDSVVYCCTLGTVTRWWRNLRGSPRVRVLLRGKEREGTAEIIERLDEKLLRLERWLEAFPVVHKTYGVSSGPNGHLEPGQVKAAAENAIVFRIRLAAQ